MNNEISNDKSNNNRNVHCFYKLYTLFQKIYTTTNKVNYNDKLKPVQERLVKISQTLCR